MICEICKQRETSGRFCTECVAAAIRAIGNTSGKYPFTKQGKPKPAHMNLTTHYRVQLRGFCCYVDIRDCRNMDEASAYALDEKNNEAWYPTGLTTPVSSEIPYVEAITHTMFVKWIRREE